MFRCAFLLLCRPCWLPTVKLHVGCGFVYRNCCLASSDLSCVLSANWSFEVGICVQIRALCEEPTWKDSVACWTEFGAPNQEAEGSPEMKSDKAVVRIFHQLIAPAIRSVVVMEVVAFAGAWACRKSCLKIWSYMPAVCINSLHVLNCDLLLLFFAGDLHFLTRPHSEWVHELKVNFLALHLNWVSRLVYKQCSSSLYKQFFLCFDSHVGRACNTKIPSQIVIGEWKTVLLLIGTLVPRSA